MAKGCIFDFDGVVMDSERYHYEAWKEVADHVGLEFTEQDYFPFKSTGRQIIIDYMIKRSGKKYTPQLYDEMYRLRAEAYGGRADKLTADMTINGVREFLQLLRDNNILCAVASASASAGILIKRFGLDKYFDTVLDGTSPLPPKPNPAIYLECAKRLNLDPSRCAVFEDALCGVEGALSAGMHTVGVGRYLEGKADKVIENFAGCDLSLIDFKETK